MYNLLHLLRSIRGDEHQPPSGAEVANGLEL